MCFSPLRSYTMRCNAGTRLMLLLSSHFLSRHGPSLFFSFFPRSGQLEYTKSKFLGVFCDTHLFLFLYNVSAFLRGKKEVGREGGAALNGGKSVNSGQSPKLVQFFSLVFSHHFSVDDSVSSRCVVLFFFSENTEQITEPPPWGFRLPSDAPAPVRAAD